MIIGLSVRVIAYFHFPMMFPVKGKYLGGQSKNMRSFWMEFLLAARIRQVLLILQ
jgi:hypothetical protein